MEENWKQKISTPALILNYDIMLKNLEIMGNFAKEHKINLRQHVKTAKIPIIAHLQRKIAGDYAKGIAVAKVGEAEVYAQSGFDDILITNEVVVPSQIKRLMLLNKYCLTRPCVDSKKNVLDLNKLAEKYDSQLEVVVDIDLGFGRTGIKPGEDSLDLVNFIKEKTSRIKVVGLQGYEGHLTPNRDETIRKQMAEECMKNLVETKDLLNKEGYNINYLTVGTSSTYKYSGRYPGITEVQPGTYVFSDDHLYSVAPEFKPAVTVLSTIQNKTGEKEFTIDAGQKAVPTGDGTPSVKDNPKIKFRLFTEEHAQLNAFEANFSLGQRIELIPAHICITVNMYDFIHIIKNGEYIGKWNIIARGKNY